jgi:phospholipase A1
MRFIFLVIVLAFNLSFANENGDPLALDKENYFKLLSTKYVLIPYKGTFLLPIVYNPKPNEDIYDGIKKSLSGNNSDFYKKEETEFQFSFMIPIQRKVFSSNFDLNVAYTHHAWWQIYNSENSRPFRETNYMPEIFLRYIDPSESRFMGFDLMAFDVGFIHHSNGQIQLLSRSWNRLFATAYFQNTGYQFFTTLWYRIPESSNTDENKNIYKYLGYGKFEISKSFGLHTISLKTPIAATHFTLDFKYSYPWKENVRWYASFETGYGNSLIEYNRYSQRFGLGLVLDSFIDRYSGIK